MDRLVIRYCDTGGFWREEYELTRVSAMALKKVWPNGVPW